MSLPPLRIGLAGAGAMGRGIAFQIAATPGMEIAWITDLNLEAAVKTGVAVTSTDTLKMLEEHPVDVFVEATNSIGDAAEYCLKAIENHAHVVLMNAEVDLALGPLLQHEAQQRGLVVTSDAGDQHGVLATMIQEAHIMGLDIVQAGNIKGFLDRSATPESIKPEADKRKLSATQCCAYTDGTKLHIEMAVLANAFGYLPPEGGMTGPRASQVQEALSAFDFDSYGETPRIDYLLGAEPGGGVYLIVKPKEDLPEEQAFYLSYYKLGEGPYYLLYRPYHLCHLETPKAILGAAAGQPILSPSIPTCEVYAYAKSDLPVSTTIRHAIGSAEVYGLVEPLDPNKVPISLLENETILKTALQKDQAITFSDLELPACPLTDLWQKQQALLASARG